MISMPDKWEFPWYAAWDLAFHCIPLASGRFEFAKDQLDSHAARMVHASERQMPAYEWDFADVNPPVHAWAAGGSTKSRRSGAAKAIAFLERIFHKLLLNFTWWVNRKDAEGNNIFQGGFLGLG